MNPLLFESIAFVLSLSAFLFGVFTVLIPKTPLYFKLIVSAVGCYALEELWVIVDVICGFDSDLFSVRLIGIFGCFCMFLTANADGLDRIIDEGGVKNRPARAIAFFAPAAILSAFAVYAFRAVENRLTVRSVIAFIVLLPAVIDSYYELKYVLLPTDEMGFLRHIKPISVLVLAEYAISCLYFFKVNTTVLLFSDVVSALVMALLVLTSERGAGKWKTLI